MPEQDRATRPSLFGLIRDVPALVSRLFREELRALQAEMAAKAKAAGVGIGLVAGGAVVALFALGALVAVVILALALAMPAWLAALIVALLLFAVAALLAWVGMKRLQSSMPPTPTDTVESVREDVRVVTGGDS